MNKIILPVFGLILFATMSLNVTIPANSDVRITVNYSIPLDATSGTPGGYMGIRFLKNGIEADGGSRKTSIYNGANSINMTTIGAAFIDLITNNTATDVTVTYALNGYIEMARGTANFRFNMWSSTEENFNWGHGTLSAQVFSKPL